MKIEFTITNNTVELLSNTDTGENALFINGVEIPSSSWVGSGYYVYDGISIKKISSLSGNVFCNKVSDTEYELAAKSEASYVTSVNGQTGIVTLDADDIPYNLTQSVGGAIDSNITAISDRALKTNIAKVEPGNTALYRHEVGTYFINKDGNMCKATSLIQVGNTITVNSNCVVVDVGGEISQINNDLNALVKSDNLASGSSVGISYTTSAFVSCGRASSSSITTSAFIDAWGGVVYVQKQNQINITVNSNKVITITNTTGSYISYICVVA